MSLLGQIDKVNELITRCYWFITHVHFKCINARMHARRHGRTHIHTHMHTCFYSQMQSKISYVDLGDEVYMLVN